MSFREGLSSFFRYVLFFGFVIAAGTAGIYFYNRQKPEPVSAVTSNSAALTPTQPGFPVPAPSEKLLPSRWLQPVMQAKLPVLFKEPDGTQSDLGADFSELETNIQTQRNLSGKNQPAWNTAAALCREIRAIAAERNTATAALQKGPPTPPPSSVVQHSKADLDDQASKQEFFKTAARQRWSVVIPARKKKIEILYRQLLAEESAQ